MEDENDSIDEQVYQLQLSRDIFKTPGDDEDDWHQTRPMRSMMAYPSTNGLVTPIQQVQMMFR